MLWLVWARSSCRGSASSRRGLCRRHRHHYRSQAALQHRNLTVCRRRPRIPRLQLGTRCPLLWHHSYLLFPFSPRKASPTDPFCSGSLLGAFHYLKAQHIALFAAFWSLGIIIGFHFLLLLCSCWWKNFWLDIIGWEASECWKLGKRVLFLLSLEQFLWNFLLYVLRIHYIILL